MARTANSAVADEAAKGAHVRRHRVSQASSSSRLPPSRAPIATQQPPARFLGQRRGPSSSRPSRPPLLPSREGPGAYVTRVSQDASPASVTFGQLTADSGSSALAPPNRTKHSLAGFVWRTDIVILARGRHELGRL